MSFPWPLDKLDVINRALARTGDNTVAVVDNGSDEWNVGSPSYDDGLGYIIEGHDWGFATQTVILQPSPTAPQDTDFDTAYPIPVDCVHILWVKIAQVPENDSGLPPGIPELCLYKIAGTPTGPVIVVNAQGGPPPPNPPVTPAQITLYYISNSGALCDSTNGTPTILLALEAFVMSGIYSGLHEDTAEGDKKWMYGEQMLQRARTRYDQQKPKRQFFNSRITASRRIRRPWPALGINNWGSGSGGGTPG